MSTLICCTAKLVKEIGLAKANLIDNSFSCKREHYLVKLS